MWWRWLSVALCSILFAWRLLSLFRRARAGEMQNEKCGRKKKNATLVPDLTSVPPTPPTHKNAQKLTFTLMDLAVARGTGSGSATNKHGFSDKQILLSVNGEIYEPTSHSSGMSFYGPGSPYHVFAGTDCTVALAKVSLAPSDINNFNFSQLQEQEKKTLAEWILRFRAKYTFCGKLADKAMTDKPLDLSAFGCVPM